jgi:hypothetical protein
MPTNAFRCLPDLHYSKKTQSSYSHRRHLVVEIFRLMTRAPNVAQMVTSHRTTDFPPTIKQSHDKYLSRRVHRLRIEVHNLRYGENQESKGRSENHLTFALLLGNGQSVRFDMTPHAMTHIGTLVVQDRDEIVSRRTVRLTDINAVGCQNSFDPDRTPSQYGRGRSVDCFLQFLLSHHMSRYRFMYVDSRAVGCRYWV